MAVTVILFVLGAIVGSFLNVVGLRWDWKRPGGRFQNFSGRSHCPKCGKVLKWYELVPVLSFIHLRARCSGCRAQISWQYPAVEILTGFIFATAPLIFLPVFCVYIVILIYDFRHKIIPDSLVYSSIVLALVLGNRDLIAGLILFAFFAAIWLITRGKAIGFGDAKLALSVGLMLGTQQGFSAIILAFWIGAVCGILYMIFSPKNITMKSEIPFAPFMILGAWLAVIFNLDLLHVSFF